MAIRDNKWSDLHIAVGSKEIKLVKALCNEKNINATDVKCRTPLELAILGHDLETVKFLV
ncbi:ankyrin repeat domain-containing protein [Rickettsia helvetica]|uniref:ankyrin repeat domain-containing protein n=1 Tax=Rickettsia helvetica TaxID=35789 RepID=UPI0002883A68